MDNVLLARKLDSAFACFDADKNGFIEERDLLALASRHGSQTITDNYHRLWKSLVDNFDRDGDGRVSRIEFHHGMANAFPDDAAYQAFFHVSVDVLLSVGDADGDGMLNIGEWTALQKGFGTREEDAQASYYLIDSDASGYLTRGELLEAVREFYTSTDPQAPGNHLFPHGH